MQVKHLAAGLVACAVVLAGEARAGDNIRLLLPGDTDAATLDLKGQADDDADLYTTQFRGWRGGIGWRGPGWGGGWRGPGWGGGWRGPGWGGWGWRSPGWGVGWRGPGWGGWGWRGGFVNRPWIGYGFRAWNPGFYSPSIYNYGYFPGYVTYPAYSTFCSPGFTQIISLPAGAPAMPFADDPAVAVTPDVKAPPGTFEYDGGPRVPLPMPKAGESAIPRYEHRPRAANELQVSAMAPPRRWVYPAYGEKARREP